MLRIADVLSSRRAAVSCWQISAVGRLMALAALWSLGGVRAAEPLREFVLPDLNAASDRVGDQVSPRDYTQWISAYYFGNEG